MNHSVLIVPAVAATAGLLMSWTVNLCDIIACAPRDFVLYCALYCALQALIAAVEERGGRNSFFSVQFPCRAGSAALSMTLFGESIE